MEPVKQQQHPSEEGKIISSSEPGLDVTAKSSLDEVDVKNEENGDSLATASEKPSLLISTSTGDAIDGEPSKEADAETKAVDVQTPDHEGTTEPKDVKDDVANEPDNDDDGDDDGKKEITETPEHDAATDDDNDDDDDDDDNMSFTSATSEQPVEEDDPETSKVTDTTIAPSKQALDATNDKGITPKENQSTIDGDKEDKDDKRSALEKIGIDKSIFGGGGNEEEDEDLFKETPPALSKTEEVEEDESALFFGASSTGNVEEPKKAVDTNSTQAKNTTSKNSSIFDDESDEDDFFKPKPVRTLSTRVFFFFFNIQTFRLLLNK